MKCLDSSIALYAAEIWTFDSDKLEAFEMWILERMEKISRLEKVITQEVLRRVKTGKYWILFGKGNISGLAMFWDTTDFCTKLLKAEWVGNRQERGEELKCCMIWQIMVAILHSNGQLRTEKDGDTEKECQ